MTRMGFGEQYINRIKACYYGSQVKLIVNGELSDKIYPTRGVRQGCPLSPLLFVISIQPLLLMLSQSEEIKGVDTGRTVNGEMIRVPKVAFMDDITLLPESELDMIEMVKVIQKYCHVSGAASPKRQQEQGT